MALAKISAVERTLIFESFLPASESGIVSVITTSSSSSHPPILSMAGSEKIAWDAHATTFVAPFSLRALTATTISATTYYNIPSFNYYLDTWGIRIILITNSNQNNNIIYSLIKTIFENNMYIRDNINNDDQKQVLQNFSVEDSFENRNIIPLHNGVKLYYKHIGLIYDNINS